MTDQPAPCRSTQHCAVHGFCHRCTPSLDDAVRHLVKAISAAGITTGSGHVYAQLAATIRDAARQTTGQAVCRHPEGYEGECPCLTGCVCCKAAPNPAVGWRCAYCGLEVEDRGHPLIQEHSNWYPIWVHVPGGYTACNPQMGAASTRALPAVGQPTEAQPADRAAILREAADALDNSETLRDLTDDHMHDVNAAADELRRMAAEAGR